MKYNDMHVHTRSSPDSDVPASRLCAVAAGNGVARIGFVAHLDLHPLDFCHGGFDEGEYLAELDAAEDVSEVTVLRGLEIGETHRYLGEARRLFDSANYDFVTGALHWVGDTLILDEKAFPGEDPLPLVRKYYEETLDMVRAGGIDILAHLGIFRRGMARAGHDCGFDETAMFPDLLREILETMISGGIALEVNVAGRRRPEGTTYPNRQILELYRALGGDRVTIGSDTHTIGHAFFGLLEGARLLKECGFGGAGFIKARQYLQSPLQ